MSLTLQVLYPAEDGTSFDHGYYGSKHMEIVGKHIGRFIESTLVTKGLAGGPGVPAPYHVVATIRFADQSALDAAMAAIGPAVADIPNFYSGKPQVLIGEVIG